MLEVKNLENNIIKDISFTVYEKNFLAVIGLNGSGKTTLINSILHSKILKNNIYLDNKKLMNFTSKEFSQRFAIIPQFNDLSFSFKAQDILEMASSISKIKVKDFYKIIEITKIKNLFNKNYNILSGGEKQRVQLARTLIQLNIFNNNKESKILLLDEHTAHLDLYQQYYLLNLLQNIQKESSLIIISILHDLNLVYKYSSHCLLLEDGRNKFFGKTKEILTEEKIKKNFKVSAKFSQTENYFSFNSF